MAKHEIEFDYNVVYNDGSLLDCTCTTALTDKDLKNIAKFLQEHEVTGETMDIDATAYAKMMDAAILDAQNIDSDVCDALVNGNAHVELQQYIPYGIVDLLPQEIVELLPQEVFDYAVEQGILEYEEEEMEIPEPNKDNTLYLTIKQVYFDEIIAGTKTIEYREIKPTTYKKFVEVDEYGEAVFDLDKITAEELESEDPMMWLNLYNNGVCPMIGKQNLWYLNLAVGYNKVRDTALVQVVDIDFEPMKDAKGNVYRFDVDENGQMVTNLSDGHYCIWQANLHLGEVVEKNIVSK